MIQKGQSHLHRGAQLVSKDQAGGEERVSYNIQELTLPDKE